MRCSHEEEAVRGEVNRPQMHRVLVFDASAVDEALLGDEAAERMDDKDDRTLDGVVQLPQNQSRVPHAVQQGLTDLFEYNFAARFSA